jgi:hypothetical protein
MSIENQLKHEFKQTAQQLKRPHQLDTQIEQLFDAHYRKQENSRKWSFSYKKYGSIAVIALCLLLFSGVVYASTLLYNLRSNHVSIEASGDSQLNFSQNQLNELRGFINEVSNHLSPGESAFVYMAELDKIKFPNVPHGPGLNKVNNPVMYSDLNQWKELTKQDFGDLKTPTILPYGFSFIKGELESPLGNIDITNDKKYYTLLKKKAIAAEKKMAWQKAVPDDSIHDKDFINNIPRIVFTNSDKDQIEISYMLVPKTDKPIKFTSRMSDISTAEKVQVADFDAYYTVNKNYFLSETGKLQDINWIEQVNGQTILYHVSSPSANVSKDELLLVANNLK